EYPALGRPRTRFRWPHLPFARPRRHRRLHRIARRFCHRTRPPASAESTRRSRFAYERVDRFVSRGRMMGTEHDIAAICDRALSWARERGYAGWDPYDGLNSPYATPFEKHWFTRLAWTHAVNLSPVNLRPALSVPHERNPKGMALFALSHLERYEATGDDFH